MEDRDERNWQANLYLDRFEAQGREECWVLPTRSTVVGYSRISAWAFGEMRKTTYGHRLFWAWENGRWPEKGEVIRHKCDNPPCVNPDHLESGSQRDNVHDRETRGRNGRSKLNADDVRTIRTRYGAGNITQGALSEEYGVTRTTINLIIARRTWAWVD